MGLIGTYKKIEQVQSETETEIITINYPADLDKDHPDFDKAGTTEEIEVPVIDTIVTEYEDAYLNIKSLNLWREYSVNDNEWLLNVTYQVFESKEGRLLDPNSFILQEAIMAISLDILNEEAIVKGYDTIKQTIFASNMIND